jgi:hypothetical protein
MRAMAPEVTSARRPTALRFAGFACVALGAVIAGVGATREWATVGFAADTEHELDVPWNGVDVWEGKVVLFAAVAALFVMLAMRVSGSSGVRRGLALCLIVLGVLCIALPVLDAITSEDRFGGTDGVDRLAAALAVDLELPEDVVREQLAELLEQDLRVEIQPGLWLTAFGGVLLVAGGILGLAWVRRGTGTERGNEAV